MKFATAAQVHHIADQAKSVVFEGPKPDEVHVAEANAPTGYLKGTVSAPPAAANTATGDKQDEQGEQESSSEDEEVAPLAKRLRLEGSKKDIKDKSVWTDDELLSHSEGLTEDFLHMQTHEDEDMNEQVIAAHITRLTSRIARLQKKGLSRQQRSCKTIAPC